MLGVHKSAAYYVQICPDTTLALSSVWLGHRQSRGGDAAGRELARKARHVRVRSNFCRE